jgi:hypothetical protein
MNKKFNHHDLSAITGDDIEPDEQTLKAEKDAEQGFLSEPASRWKAVTQAPILKSLEQFRQSANNQKRKLVDDSPIYEADPSKWPPPEDYRKPEPKPKIISGGPPVGAARREHVERQQAIDRILKNNQTAADLKDTTPTKTKTLPEQKPEKKKSEPKEYGSKCVKHKAGLNIHECLICEFFAENCKGYPGSFQMVPKIVELVLPIIKGNDFKVWYYIFSTMGTDKWNKEKYLQSYVSNIKIELATGVKNKHLAENYKRLEDANLLRKQTDDVFYKSGPQKGKFKNRRNHFSFNCFFEDYLKLKALNDKLLIKHGRGETALKQRDRTNFVLSQRALRDRKTTK